MAENRMTSAPSPEGRRILVAVVTGAAGERIQAWRLQHDADQAWRLPPHTTLCYWAPSIDADLIERQLHHAFVEPVSVQLAGVHEFSNDQHTFYVEVTAAQGLDAAAARLCDGRYLELPPMPDPTWHVTCVRDSRDRDIGELRRAARDLELNIAWRVDTVAYLELSGGRYQTLATWSV